MCPSLLAGIFSRVSLLMGDRLDPFSCARNVIEQRAQFARSAQSEGFVQVFEGHGTQVITVGRSMPVRVLISARLSIAVISSARADWGS